MAEAAPSRARSRYQREHVLLIVCIVLLLLATIPPLINLGRYQRRIATAISRSIGRPVTMGSVSLRLLPWPAFQIENLSVAEEPAFGSEPTLFAPEVTIEPRLWSLWRSRFELSRVELTDASVNLVRNADGRWNIGSVLLQASHVANAPTGQRHAGPAPRFPYIEATGTRINVKQGVEKLPYSLLDADFSMWLASPEVWGVKLEGQPERTDLVVSMEDTGTLHLEGELHRASALGAMPVSLRGSWDHAPMFELGRLLLGRDVGWRGDVDADARLTGQIDNLGVATHVSIDNLHREEFTPDEPFTVRASCRLHYSRSTPMLDALHCRWPLGDGGFALTHQAGSQAGTLKLDANRVPAYVLAAAVHLVRPGAPSADRFSGELSGSLLWDAGDAKLIGTMQMPSLDIAGAGPDGSALTLHDLTATAAPDTPPVLVLAAQPLAMGLADAPMHLGAQLTRAGFRFNASGGATLTALASAASALHLPQLHNLAPIATGPAALHLAVSSEAGWMSGGAAPSTSGTLHLSNVRWSPSWLPVSVELQSADATLGPAALRWTSSTATLGAGPDALRLAGFVEVPLNCAEPANCENQFALSTPTLNIGSLEGLLGSDRGRLFSTLLRRFDGSELQFPAFVGSLRTPLLTMGRLPIQNAAVLLSHAAGGGALVHIESIDGTTLGGTIRLAGTVALPADTAPHYTLHAALTGASAAQAAALWHENWGTGLFGGTARFTTTGTSENDLLGNITGNFQIAWQHGAFPPVLPRFTIWEGSGTVGPEGLTIAHSAFSGTPETATGVIGWDRTIDLTVNHGTATPPESVTGTLNAPHASPQSQP